MALVIVALLTVFIGGLRLLSQAQDVAQAGSLARTQVERIREGSYSYGYSPVNVTFDGRTPDATVGGFPPPPYPGQNQGKDYKVVVRVKTLDDKLNSIFVEVHWDNDKVQTLETIIHR